MATRSKITTQIQNLTGKNESDFQTTIHGHIDAAIREWSRLRPWPSLRREISLYANGTRYLTMPSFVERPVSVFDVTNVAPVAAGSHWDEQYPGGLAQGTVSRAIEWQDAGYVATTVDPTGHITIQSSHASDTATVYFEGFIHDSGASGTPMERILVQDSLSLNGQTPVSSTYDFEEILSIGKSSDTSGYVTVKDAVAGSVISRLGLYEDRATLRRIQFMRRPAAGTHFEVTVITRPPTLESDDNALHPSIDADFVKWYASALVLYQIGERQAGAFYEAKAEKKLEDAHQRELNFGDNQIQMLPLYDMYGEEEGMTE